MENLNPKNVIQYLAHAITTKNVAQVLKMKKNAKKNNG